MSKRADEEADIEAGMTTAERRRRRRRGGGLRVPSDNVPRRSPTTPPPVAPVPEDPNLAVSIAYSFSSDQSGPLPRSPDTGEIAAVDRPDTLQGDGPDVGDEILAPDAQSTVVDVDDGADSGFEAKTREMTAVDLEELGLEDPNGEGKPRRSGPIPKAGPSDSIIIDDDQATKIQEPPRRPSSGPLAAASSPLIPSSGTAVPPPMPRSARDSDARRLAPEPSTPPPRPATPSKPPPEPPASVASGTRPKMPTPAPAYGIVEMTPLPADTPRALSEADDFEDEKSVEINFEDPSKPGIVTMQPNDRARPVVTRAATVALSDDDLEELMDPDHKRSKVTNASGETLALTDTDLEDDSERGVPKVAKATKDESGEIVVDVVEEIDSGDIASPVAAVAATAPAAPAAPTPTLRGLGTPGAPTPTPPTSMPAVTAPPATAPAAGNGAPQHRPPPTPPQPGKPVEAHAPPPPPAAAQAKAPPPAPTPGKKPATPAGATTAAAVAAAVKAPAADKRVKRSKPWFEEIFDEDYLRTLPFLTPQATQAEAQFVVDVLNVQPGAQLLDLGCGYGRHAMELAARGFHLVGLDLSLPLLLRGADEAQRRGLSINFVHADMRELDFDAQFDGVYCLFSTFGFFDDETNKKTATSVARALKPGGRFVIEVLNRDYVIGELPTRVWWEGDGCVVLEEVEFNYFSSRIHSNRSVVFDDGRQIEQEISIRAYSLHELGKLLHAAGFRVVEVSGSVHTRGRYFGNHSRHIIVVAEKKPRDGADGK